MHLICYSNSLLLFIQKVNDNLLQIDNLFKKQKIFFYFLYKKRYNTKIGVCTNFYIYFFKFPSRNFIILCTRFL